MLERLPYFRFHAADYLLDTLGLTQEEHGAYLLLILNYYWNGSLPHEPDQVYELARADNEARRTAVDRVLKRYFHEENGLITHNRIERELGKYGEFLRSQSEAGKASAAARAKSKPAPTTPARGNGSATTPATRGTRLPANWQPNDEGAALATELGVDAIEQIQVFRDYWIAQPGTRGVKLDWEATWRNWIRRDAKAPNNARRTQGPPWWSSNAGIEAKGKELGMTARGGESWVDYKARIEARIAGT